MVADQIQEVIFVGIPGPTHQYGGLSEDNVASGLNRGSLSNPREAALQALELVRLLMSLGVRAAVLPPQLRPHMPLLRQHFTGDDEAVIREASRAAPNLLVKASSAAAMWTANAATVTPGIDNSDGLLHITAANLFTNLHRRIEADDTYRVLQAIFRDVPRCVVHSPLSAAAGLCDEGAANHMRLCPSHRERGLNVFVYGANGSPRDPESARQTLSASRAIQQAHHIPDEAALFVRQNPEVIREGVFHNDVIAVSNEYVLLSHALAFDRPDDAARMAEAYAALHPGKALTVLSVEEEELTVEEAVHTYFFNSQIVTKPGGGMALIAPVETQLLYEGNAAVVLECIRDDDSNPIDEIHTIDLRQSMRNGGGPACLRLRVPMSEAQLAAVQRNVRVLADDVLLMELENTIRKLYPESLDADGLANPQLYMASRDILEAFSATLRLPLLAAA